MCATATTPAKPFKSHDRILRCLALICAAGFVFGALIVLGF